MNYNTKELTIKYYKKLKIRKSINFRMVERKTQLPRNGGKQKGNHAL